MANVLINIGTMDASIFRDALTNGLNEIGEFYNADALLKFCERIGIDSFHVIPLRQNIHSLKSAIATHIEQKIQSRQESLKEQGYALLLEHCVTLDTYGSPHINYPKLNTYLGKYKDLKKFIDEKFADY